jgi:hypothetical protein
MNERQRMQYLDALGIDSFVPRLQLANALVSELCELPVAANASSGSALARADDSSSTHGPLLAEGSLHAEGSSSSASFANAVAPLAGVTAEKPRRRSFASVTSLLQGGDGKPAEAAVQSTLPAHSVTPAPLSNPSEIIEKPVSPLGDAKLSASDPTSANTNDTHIGLEPSAHTGVEVGAVSLAERADTGTEVARFSLAFWRVSQDLLVVDSREVGAALPTEALLLNILRSTCQPAPQRLPEAKIQNHPLVDLPGKPRDWVAGRELVASFLEGQLLTQPVTQVLILGVSAFRALVGADLATDTGYRQSLYQKVPIDAFATDAVVLPSLTEVLRNPQLKRKLWQALHNEL